MKQKDKKNKIWN